MHCSNTAHSILNLSFRLFAVFCVHCFFSLYVIFICFFSFFSTSSHEYTDFLLFEAHNTPIQQQKKTTHLTHRQIHFDYYSCTLCFFCSSDFMSFYDFCALFSSTFSTLLTFLFVHFLVQKKRRIFENSRVWYPKSTRIKWKSREKKTTLRLCSQFFFCVKSLFVSYHPIFDAPLILIKKKKNCRLDLGTHHKMKQFCWFDFFFWQSISRVSRNMSKERTKMTLVSCYWKIRLYRFETLFRFRWKWEFLEQWIDFTIILPMLNCVYALCWLRYRMMAYCQAIWWLDFFYAEMYNNH